MKKITFTSVAALVVALGTVTVVSAAPPTKLRKGSVSPGVATLQRYLHSSVRGNFYNCSCGFDGNFGPVTQTGLKRWQKAADYRTTGWVTIGSSQWNRLRREATVFRPPAYIDSLSIAAARRTGWAVDASKSPGIVSVLHYDNRRHTMSIALSIAASYGGWIDGAFRPTADGVGHIYAKGGQGFRSSQWHNAPMPWPAFFNGGEALHYDPLGASHGCIHIPSMTAAKYIHDLPYGTAVVVHG